MCRSVFSATNCCRKSERDPSWVSANNFEMVTPQGEVAGAGKVSEDMLSELGTGELQLRQKPGPKNTLGLVKFVFPNEYGVYMHDTSAQWLFARERRDLSHGCIRVEKPEDLAEWVLREQSGWSRDRIAGSDAGDGIGFRKGQAPDSNRDHVLDCRGHEERRGALFPGYLWRGRGPRKGAGGATEVRHA